MKKGLINLLDVRSKSELPRSNHFGTRCFDWVVCFLLVLAAGGKLTPTITHAASDPKIDLQPAPIPRESRPALSFAPIVKKISSSVVTIYSTKKLKDNSRNPLLNDPFLRRFFGLEEDDDSPTRRPHFHQEQSLGSGVIVSTDGFILSNYHVVEGADEVKVGLPDGHGDVMAKVIGTDPPTDIAVLKVPLTNLTAVTMTDSDNVQVGDVVLAAGNPFGVGQTVTMGIVSALGRGGFGVVDYEDFIQTDASINPGNSGGPLVDTEGRLVGINTFILSGSGGSMGIGFAVPINMARYVMDRINHDGRVARGYLGVYVQPVTAELAKAFNLSDQSGALLGGVSPGTPAARAGLKEGDVITHFDGKKLTDSRHLRLMVAQTRPNTEASVKYLREGKEMTTTATLGELTPEQAVAPAMKRGSTNAKGEPLSLEGVEVGDLDARSRQQFGIPAEIEGALVLGVASGTSAYEAGLRSGDIILEMNHHKIRNARDAIEVSNKVKDRALMRIWSKTGSRFLVVAGGKKK
jgi:serine protease Do